MLGFTPDFSHAFCKDRICTQLDIMYIIFTTYFYICLTRDRTWSMPLGMVCSRELHYLAITSSAQTTRRDFYDSPSFPGWGGWTLQNYSMSLHVKTGGKKNPTPWPTTFGSLNSKSRNLDLRLGGCGIRVIDGLFFKFLEDKDQKIEDWFDPQPDSAIQPKTRGLLHMEREFIAHHIKDDSGLDHLIASMQPRKYSKDYSKHSKEYWRISKALEVLEDSFRSTWCM